MAKWIVEDVHNVVVFVGEQESDAQAYRAACSSAYVEHPFVLFYNGNEIEVGDSFAPNGVLVKGT